MSSRLFSPKTTATATMMTKEVDKILNKKKELLSFINDDGKPNTLRFLFSKWTLKEGWDNPNVFTIANFAPVEERTVSCRKWEEVFDCL